MKYEIHKKGTDYIQRVEFNKLNWMIYDIDTVLSFKTHFYRSPKDSDDALNRCLNRIKLIIGGKSYGLQKRTS